MRHLRSSIAGLMGGVLIAAVGLAALKSASPAWAGAIFLLTRAVLGLAIINAIYRDGARRAWWLGFCVFGWGYLASVQPRDEMRTPDLFTSSILIAIKPCIGHPAESDPVDGYTILRNHDYLRIGHDLWALVAAALGGLGARIVFALSADRSRPVDGEAHAADRPPRKPWLRPTIIAWAGLVLATSAATIRSAWNAGFWAGATFLLTGGLLGLACLGAIVDRGPRRPAWLGAGLLGAGYMILVFAHRPSLPLPTGQLLNALREWAPAIATGSMAANARILETLERPVPMTFPEPTPLSDVLKSVTRATATPTDPGIPIYLDPLGLQEAEVRPSSTVTIDLRGIPLRTTLRLCLHQRGLGYTVKDGFLWVTAEDSLDTETEDPFIAAAGLHWERSQKVEFFSDLEDPFLVVGHCLLAVLAAGFGAAVAPLVADARRERSGRSSCPVGDAHAA